MISTGHLLKLSSCLGVVGLEMSLGALGSTWELLDLHEPCVGAGPALVGLVSEGFGATMLSGAL